jgi:DtxR family transcriptional regulator, Mn-dependent transcriptional regulator
MPSLTVENYLKAILQISLQKKQGSVSTGNLAEELSVSPGTVTSMLKSLADANLINYVPYEGASLKQEGRKLAIRMLRRHRLIELFLVNTLNLTWDTVHQEAENMEHSVSDFLIDRIDEFLGHPATDPHGDPIPTSEGIMRTDLSSVVPLEDCAEGTRVRFVRVINQSEEFLRFLSNSGFKLGETGIVIENNPEANIVKAQLDDSVLTIGQKAASQLLVEPVES